jgi:NitT/TauT family transport system permease protein
VTKPLSAAFSFRGSISRRAHVLVGLASSFAVLLAWQLSSWSGLVDPTFLPAPLDIAHTLWKMTLDGQIIGNALISTGRILAAFVLSAVMAIPIGLMMSSYRPINAALEPMVDFIRYLPTPALVPISIIWFGLARKRRSFCSGLGLFSSSCC